MLLCFVHICTFYATFMRDKCVHMRFVCAFMRTIYVQIRPISSAQTLLRWRDGWRRWRQNRPWLGLRVPQRQSLE